MESTNTFIVSLSTVGLLEQMRLLGHRPLPGRAKITLCKYKKKRFSEKQPIAFEHLCGKEDTPSNVKDQHMDNTDQQIQGRVRVRTLLCHAMSNTHQGVVHLDDVWMTLLPAATAQRGSFCLHYSFLQYLNLLPSRKNKCNAFSVVACQLWSPWGFAHAKLLCSRKYPR